MLQQKAKMTGGNVNDDTRIEGLAARTQRTQASDLKWYDEYAQKNDEPVLVDLTVEYVSGDNGRELIVRYMSWLAKLKLERIMWSLPPLMCPLIQKENSWKTLLVILSQNMEAIPMFMGSQGDYMLSGGRK
jgi:hypothetical protein